MFLREFCSRIFSRRKFPPRTLPMIFFKNSLQGFHQEISPTISSGEFQEPMNFSGDLHQKYQPGIPPRICSRNFSADFIMKIFQEFFQKLLRRFFKAFIRGFLWGFPIPISSGNPPGICSMNVSEDILKIFLQRFPLGISPDISPEFSSMGFYTSKSSADFLQKFVQGCLPVIPPGFPHRICSSYVFSRKFLGELPSEFLRKFLNEFLQNLSRNSCRISLTYSFRVFAGNSF